MFIKDIRSLRARGVCPLKTRGFFRCGRTQFLVQSTFAFSKFMVCPHEQGGLSQCGHFSDKEEGKSVFRDFVWTSLRTVKNSYSIICNEMHILNYSGKQKYCCRFMLTFILE